MYGKVFSSMYDGTLATKGPWQALVTFQQMIVLADKDGVVDMTADAISRRTSIPREIIEIGIRELSEPDDESRTPDEDGRRIVLLEGHRTWGWQIVNYAKYAALRSAEERREYMRIAQAEHRARVKAAAEASKGVKGCQDKSGIVKMSTDVPVDVPVPVPETLSMPPVIVAPHPVAVSGLPNAAIDAFAAMRFVGVFDGHAGHPDLLALVAAGAIPAEFQAAAADAVGRGKGFAYAIGALKRNRINAAQSLSEMHKGALPNKQQALEKRNRAVGADWLAQQVPT